MYSKQLGEQIERSLKEGVADFTGVTYFTALRIATSAIGSYFSWYSDRVIGRLRRRILSHFEIRLLSADFRRDLSQSRNPAEEANITASEVWSAFDGLHGFFRSTVEIASQLILILNLSRSGEGGMLFALLCFLKPLIASMVKKNPWDEVCIVRRRNEDEQRFDTLSGLSKPRYREDVISNDLQNFILGGLKSASKRLVDIPSVSQWEIFDHQDTPTLSVILTVMGDLPMAYCAVLALLFPKHTSFASIAILQQSASGLARFLSALLRNSQQFKVSLKHVRDLYDVTKGLDDEEDTHIAFCDKSTELEDATLRQGEGIEYSVRNVSFSYPGSQVSGEALSNINLNIKSGQFVVLVGVNGSGKSTLLKLLLRLYEPSSTRCEFGKEKDNASGQILIDSIPASSYTESSLRQSMAVLSQDTLIYPGFSLGENIGLGYTPLIEDESALRDAAIKAGAQSVLERMKDKMSTVLDPPLDFHAFNVREQDESHPLRKVLEDLQRPTDLSGGEGQRIVAARTFMRLKSGKIRFLAVDEPSSALDSEGEELLLDNLLKEREGKTVVFVTHRFGKLTQQADLIVCMKEGKIVESGTHKELIDIPDGEYKKLYDIQASPFLDGAKYSPPSLSAINV